MQKEYILILIITTSFLLIVSLSGRFIFHTTSKEFLLSVKRKFNLNKIFRIHHVFIGLFLLLLSLPIKSYNILYLGIGIVLSDIMHHMTLKIITGNSEFSFKDNKFIK